MTNELLFPLKGKQHWQHKNDLTLELFKIQCTEPIIRWLQKCIVRNLTRVQWLSHNFKLIEVTQIMQKTSFLFPTPQQHKNSAESAKLWNTKYKKWENHKLNGTHKNTLNYLSVGHSSGCTQTVTVEWSVLYTWHFYLLFTDLYSTFQLSANPFLRNAYLA